MPLPPVPLSTDPRIAPPPVPPQSTDLHLALLELGGALAAPPAEPPVPAAPPRLAAAPPAIVAAPAASVALPLVPAAPPQLAAAAPPPLAAAPPPVTAVPLPFAGPPSVPPAVGPRVELGFADGSTGTLDPSSAAAKQLSELVAELTRQTAAPTAS